VSLPRLVKQYHGHADRGVFFTLAAPVENTDWLDGQTMTSPVKHDSVVVPAGAVVAVEAISTTTLDEGTDEPQARVLFRVTQGQGQPWFWHRVTLRPSDRAALEALTLRFTRPRVTW
jgi:hypothetical protein